MNINFNKPLSYALLALLGLGIVLIFVSPNIGNITFNLKLGVSSNKRPKQPHIVFIVADDLGWNDVGYHGSTIQTPNIDRLAREGIKLENYYVQSLCTPSRSQLLSGRHQIHTGLQHMYIPPAQPNGLPLDIPTLPQILRDQGYATHAVGKWHLGFYKEEYTPIRRGFDTFFGFLGGSENHFSHTKCFTYLQSEHCGLDLWDGLNVAPNYTGVYSTHLYTMKATDIIETHARSSNPKPLFLYLSYQAVHSPLEVPNSYVEPYRHLITHSQRQQYAGLASCMDEGIGNVTQVLQQHGLMDDTLLIFTTDNGGQVSKGASNWPFKGNKGSPFEGGIRAVGFVHGNLLRNTKGTSSRALMHVSDWMPTLVRLAGGDVGSLTLDGLDLWDSISYGSPSKRVEILHDMDPLSTPVGDIYPKSPFDNRYLASIRVDKWKLITGKLDKFNKYFPPLDNFTSNYTHETTAVGVNEGPLPFTSHRNIWLYDMEADPLEQHDLTLAHPDMVLKLLHRLAEHQSTAVPCRYPEFDPQSSPMLHEGVWRPWRS